MDGCQKPAAIGQMLRECVHWLHARPQCKDRAEEQTKDGTKHLHLILGQKRLGLAVLVRASANPHPASSLLSELGWTNSAASAA